MKHFSKLLMTLCLVAGFNAYASVVFTLGNDPNQPGEENVLFTSDQTAAMVTGVTNQSGATVDFSSTTDILTVTASGQAMVGASDGAVNNITIALANGATYQDLIINPFLGGSVAAGPATVTVVASDGTFTFDYPGGLGNGENFLTITTSGGESIISTTIDASTGFDNLKQPRISGVAAATVPEPGSLLTLAGGVLALGLIKLRKRLTA